MEGQASVGERSQIQRVLEEICALCVSKRRRPFVGFQVLEQSHHLYSYRHCVKNKLSIKVPRALGMSMCICDDHYHDISSVHG